MKTPVSLSALREHAWPSYDNDEERCQSCGICTTSAVVCLEGEGPEDADVMLVGEAPGADEERLEKNFCGRAGEMLNGCLIEAEFLRSELYVCNSVRCRPTTPNYKNRKPTIKEIGACRDFLIRDITRVRPRVIVALGDSPATALLGKMLGGVTQNRGRVRWVDEFNAYVVVTFHPAYALRTPGMREFIVEDLRTAKRILEDGPRMAQPTEIEVISSVEDARRARDEILTVGKFHFDLEANGLHIVKSRAFLYSFSTRDHHAYIFRRFSRHWAPRWSKSELHEIDTVLRDLLSSDCEKGGFNVAYDNNLTRSTLGIYPRNVTFCGMIAHHLFASHLGERAHALKVCAALYLDVGRYDDVLDQWLVDNGYTDDGKPDMTKINHAPEEMVDLYAGMDSDCSRRLEPIFRQRMIDLGVIDCFQNERMPLLLEHQEIDRIGVRINQQHLDDISHELTNAITVTEQQIVEAAGPELMQGFPDGRINPSSHAQVARLLFGYINPTTREKRGLSGVDVASLDLPVLARTETGAPATGEEYLRELADLHPVVSLIMRHRAYVKIKGTWIDGTKTTKGQKKALRAALDEDGYARMNTRIAGPETLRFATRKPFPLHTFPKSEPGMPRVRALVIPDDGFRFVTADFKQQEFAIQAILSGQEDLIEAIVDRGEDAHERVGIDLFGLRKSDFLVPSARRVVDVGGGHYMTIQDAVSQRVPLPPPIMQSLPLGMYEHDGLLWASHDAYDTYKKKRTLVKNVNFLIMFKGGARKLARLALGCRCFGGVGADGVTVCDHYSTARRYIFDYYERYEGIKWFHYKTEKFLRQHGFVREPFGAVRKLPGIFSPDEYTQAEAVRQSVNFPIQRSGNAILVRALLGICRQLRGDPPLRAAFPGRVVFTVHDELTAQVRSDLVDDGCEIVRRHMEQSHKELGMKSIRTDRTVSDCWGG